MRIHWGTLMVGLMWAVYETDYFGWHRRPSSDAEIICDGIAFLILAIAFTRRTPESGQ